MGNKRLKKKAVGLKIQIEEHEDKIRHERRKDFPDEGMIRHWEKEIASFMKGIEKIKRRIKYEDIDD